MSPPTPTPTLTPTPTQPTSQSVRTASTPPPIFVRIPLIQASALVAELVTYPIDLIKTRFQVSAHREGYSQIFHRTVKADGVAGLYKGIQPAVIRHWIYTASRVLIYEDLRNVLAKQTWAGGDVNNPPIAVKMISGFSAGAIGQLIASPADLVKIRLQTDSKTYRGFVNAVRMIYRQEGLVGFYRGWRPNVTRAALVNLGELATYDQAKHTVLTHTSLKDGPVTHTLSALLSGLLAAFCSTPADVCKSRVMSGVYPTMTACLVGTVKQEGVLALWKGFLPNWLRLGPWQFCFWLTYETLRKKTTGQGF